MLLERQVASHFQPGLRLVNQVAAFRSPPARRPRARAAPLILRLDLVPAQLVALSLFWQAIRQQKVVL
jgi:hypothetical protein